MKRYWFTFIEILIAIIVFSIWIFAVLGLVTSNLRWVERNDLRLQGTLLAKEGLELVYNLRDSNLERELPRNCIMKHEIYGWNADTFGSELGKCVAEMPVKGENPELTCICPHYFGKSSPIKVSYSDRNYVVVDYTDTTFSWNRLYMHTGSRWELWYSHDNDGGQETVFSRYITFDYVLEDIWNPLEKNSLDTGKILKVSSHVLWEKWSYTGEVVLESFIWNY